jgi:hypothetical protein
VLSLHLDKVVFNDATKLLCCDILSVLREELVLQHLTRLRIEKRISFQGLREEDPIHTTGWCQGFIPIVKTVIPIPSHTFHLVTRSGDGWVLGLLPEMQNMVKPFQRAENRKKLYNFLSINI